ncbi:MAG: DUF3097 family protein [Acidimicrobiia bacterium]|nr:DUF3097 family protein [Acidimicrobiia bacterium]
MSSQSKSSRWSSRDIIASDAAARSYPKLAVARDLELTHRPSRVSGRVVSFTEGQRIVLSDIDGTLHEFKPHAGVLLHRGKPVELVAGDWASQTPPAYTASGSIDTGPMRARTAGANRIWVEGIHDAELVERIWGDDLRIEGIVVEPLHGVDDLPAAVRSFAPSRNRRLGVLLDHLVPGSKESRIAAEIVDSNVLICGHPYVDIWQAVKPEPLGIAAWPDVPSGLPWKEGVITALGRVEDPGRFWQSVLSRVSSYRDVETPLVNSVEQLIDFVTAG